MVLVQFTLDRSYRNFDNVSLKKMGIYRIFYLTIVFEEMGSIKDSREFDSRRFLDTQVSKRLLDGGPHPLLSLIHI